MHVKAVKPQVGVEKIKLVPLLAVVCKATRVNRVLCCGDEAGPAVSTSCAFASEYTGISTPLSSILLQNTKVIAEHPKPSVPDGKPSCPIS